MTSEAVLAYQAIDRIRSVARVLLKRLRSARNALSALVEGVRPLRPVLHNELVRSILSNRGRRAEHQPESHGEALADDAAPPPPPIWRSDRLP